MNLLLIILCILLAFSWFLDHSYQKAQIKKLKEELSDDKLDMWSELTDFEKRALEEQEVNTYYPIHHSL